MEGTLDLQAVHRLLNAFDQFILKIMEMNQVVIHANSGKVISLLLNLSLACDYRIVADDTVFENPYIRLGLLPKGGGAYFLSRLLGHNKAFEVLLSDGTIDAFEALRLGIVEKVVPVGHLLRSALDMAEEFCRIPYETLSGVKRLLNLVRRDLQDMLEFENHEIMRIIGSTDMSSPFWKRLKEQTEMNTDP
jgi:2-(1,2-epoxy-1,2-dihydrophenyl)acetyl-CoA isomerase